MLNKNTPLGLRAARLCIAIMTLSTSKAVADSFHINIPSYHKDLQEIFDSSPSRYLAFDSSGQLTLPPQKILEISNGLKRLPAQDKSFASSDFSYDTQALGYKSQASNWNVDSLAFVTGYLLALPEQISIHGDEGPGIPAWWLGLSMSELLIHPESSSLSGILDYSDQRLDALANDIKSGKVTKSQLAFLKSRLASIDALGTANKALKVRILERNRSLDRLLKGLKDDAGLGATTIDNDHAEIVLHGVLTEESGKQVSIGTIDNPNGFWLPEGSKRHGVEALGVNKDSSGADLLFLQGRWKIPVRERSANWNLLSAELYNRIKKGAWAELLPPGKKTTSIAEFAAKANSNMADMESRLHVLDEDMAQGTGKIIEGLLSSLDSNAVNKIETESVVMYFIKLQNIKSLLAN